VPPPRRWPPPPGGAARAGSAIAVAPADTPAKWDSDGVLLGRISVSARGDVVVDPATPAPRAGLDPRGPFRGTVGVLGDLGVGTAEPTAHGDWSRALDVAGKDAARLIVRAKGITGVVGAHPGVYGAPGGWAAGTETDHAASIVTRGQARLTVTSAGDVGIGTTTPSTNAAWTRSLDVYGSGSSRLVVRTKDITSVVGAIPAGYDAGGWIAGTETDHAASIITNGLARLTVTGGMKGDTGAGRLGVGTTTPKAKLHVVGMGGPNVDVMVNGRLKSANEEGGLHIGDDRLVGGLETNKLGLYSGHAWRLTVTSAGDVGIGTTTPSTNAAWTRTLDVYDSQSSRLVVRTKDIIGLVGAIPVGYDAGGWVAGTETAHAASIVTASQARLTVTSAGDVCIGTPAPSNNHWGRAVELHNRWNARYVVRATDYGMLGVFGVRHDGAYGSAAGLLVGTESAHPVNLVTNSATRLAVTSDGNVGIGTTAPTVNQFWSRVLDITGKDSARLVVRAGDMITVAGAHPGGYGAPTGMVVGTESKHSISLISGNTNRLTVDPDGNIFCHGTMWFKPVSNLPPDPGRGPTEKRWWWQIGRWNWNPNHLEGGNAVLHWGSEYTVSDGRLKEDLREFDGAVATVSKLRGVTFRWNEAGLRFQTRPAEEQAGAGPGATEAEHAAARAEVREALLPGLRGRREVGVVAQEVEAVLPELVGTDADGVRGVDYRKLTAVLVQAIKEQQRTITTLERRVGALEMPQEDDRA
ncbi:tail fiber domain-containing protein, partial [Frankia sp. CN7]|uniref:tail fiber domain-containing protein n=1 Tax=Frankia nepalensis TaxID=1836974 RepID=UPI0019346740